MIPQGDTSVHLHTLNMLNTLVTFAEAFLDRRFDADSLATLRAHPEATRVALVEIINRVGKSPMDFQELTGESACGAVVLVLLNEFGTPDALPGLIGAVSHKWSSLDAVFGDSITEDAPEAFAACGASDPTRLLSYAEQAGTSPPARFMLMAGAIRHLARGALSPDAVAATARRILPEMCATAKAALNEGVDHDEACFAITYLVGELSDVLVYELRAELLEVFREDLMLDMFMHESDVSSPRDASDAAGCAKFRKRYPQVTDAGKIIEKWVGVMRRANDRAVMPAYAAPVAKKELPPARIITGYTPGKPFVRNTEKVSPNAPCACGSGKKYKKCCAGKQA